MAWACLFLVILTHLAERTIALALLFVTHKSWLAAVLAAEMGLLLLYLVLRSDFIVWVPGASFGVSFIYRVVSKLMLDFCSLPQMRHPLETGAVYWLFSIVTNQAVCLMSVWAYADHYDGPGKIARTPLFAAFGALAVVWAAAVAGFLLSIESQYLWTFVSFETGRGYIVRFFHETEGDDARRTQIFLYNRKLWESIRLEVAAWSLDNYDRWQTEQPAWFTPALIRAIPDDCMPKECLVYEPALLRRHRGVRGLDGDLD